MTKQRPSSLEAGAGDASGAQQVGSGQPACGEAETGEGVKQDAGQGLEAVQDEREGA